MEIVLADSPVHVIAKRSIYLLLHPIIVDMVTFIIVALPFGCWIYIYMYLLSNYKDIYIYNTPIFCVILLYLKQQFHLQSPITRRICRGWGSADLPHGSVHCGSV